MQQHNYVPFYDNAKVEPDKLGFLFVDRVYCFAWDEFSDEDWQNLAKVYEELPGWLGYSNEGHIKGYPCWFSLDEESLDSHLSASQEPPGLQVTGNITSKQLLQWHEYFLKLTQNLPKRKPAN